MPMKSFSNATSLQILVFLVGFCIPSSAFANENDLADLVLKSAGLDRGMCLNLDDADGKLTTALAKASRLCVQGSTWDATTVPASRATIVAAGLDDRASTIAIEAKGLPYADNLINLVVCASWGRKDIALNEILRVLAPGGKAIVGNDANPAATAELDAELKKAGVKDIQALPRRGWLQFVKPIDAGLDAWTHRLGGADLSSVNDDKRVGPWAEVRWIGDPRWGALYLTYMGRVTGGGRLYYKENRAAESGATQTWLAARDAYNGFELWRTPAGTPFKKSYYALDDTLTCDDQAVYSVEDDKLVGRDGQTGKKIREYDPGFLSTTVTAAGNVLLTSSKTKAAALAKATGKVLWTRATKAHPAADQSNAYVLGATELEAFDLATGKPRWKTKASTATGIPQVFCKGDIVYVSFKPTWTPTTLLAAYDAKDGNMLWKQDDPKGDYGILPYKDEVVLLERKNVLSDNVMVRVLEPRSGQMKREYLATGLVGGHCFTSKGTGNFVVYSSSWYLNRESGSTFEPNTVRSPCRLGQMPANGLTYFLPQHCDCKVFLRGMLAMAPAGTKKWIADINGEGVTRLTAIADAPAALTEKADDWPIFRHDPRRSNATTTKLPDQLKPLWTETLGRSKLTQAVAAYGIVCVAEPRTGRVFARDAATGKERWSYSADGQVDYPPALHRGLCFFGTSSGSVVALDALTGKEIWILRAAPAEKYIAEEGRFASAWPVVGGVMPMGDEVFFNCGRAVNVDGGLRMFAANAATGKIRWRVPGGSSADLFTSDGADLMLTRTFYRTKDGGRILGAKKSNGLLHTTHYYSPVSVLDYMASVEPALTNQRHVDLTDGQVTGEALAFNDKFGVAAWRYRFGVPPALMKKDKPNERFIYAAAGDRKVQWLLDDNIRQQMVAVVLSGETAYLAGVPTSLDAKDTSELWVLSGTDGKQKQVLTLESRPVYDGLSIAGERLYLATEEGRLLCFGAK